MAKSARGKTVYFQAFAWYNADTGHIHLAARDDGLISTVSGDPSSKRYHPNLFGKLARLLRDSGAPYPEGAVSADED